MFAFIISLVIVLFLMRINFIQLYITQLLIPNELSKNGEITTKNVIERNRKWKYSYVVIRKIRDK
jgi:uncharacterized protein YneF (UPF0154 family)